ncbi:L-carnitine dehydratase/bile acid-inducible protein F [Burkholderia ambifaria AMMD]|uniref:L-carnitine dehydratase/bile acid-inducible protein F n=2 Tax=Burkholderia ambifaria TaxID=152480 RepID=Q0BG80_BURCM|nr:L-carnitine dehydratase/bile acid-inducible protein F [Burkholderia ambifaria AMMD]
MVGMPIRVARRQAMKGDDSTMGALSHIRVLDLTRVLAGPWCAQTLADFGADVIKIERPGAGDDTRHWGPPYLKDAAGADTAEAAYYLAANRNKRSVTVDIATPEGQQIVRELAAQSDVVLENYKVGQLAKYGLDYESLRAVKPDLVYCSVTGFGQTGPYAHRAGYDFIVQGIGGFMSITGERDSEPGGGPQKAGVAIADLATGLYSTIAVLAALAHRDRTGEGQYIDMALLDVQVALLANMNTNFLASGKPPVRWGNAHPNIVPYQTFQTSDGWIIVAVGNDGQFRKFVEAGGRAELADDERFATNPSRVRHRDTLVPILAEMVKTRAKADWIGTLEAAGVPCGPINELDEVFDNEQVVARGMQVSLPHPCGADVKLVRNPIRMSATPPDARTAPPLLGAQTEAVLRDMLGYDAARIAALKAKQAI